MINIIINIFLNEYFSNKSEEYSYRDSGKIRKEKSVRFQSPSNKTNSNKGNSNSLNNNYIDKGDYDFQRDIHRCW